MTITLVRPNADEALALAALLAPPSVTCGVCGGDAPMDEDTARTRWGWVISEDDGLVCEDCATAAGPAGAYDRAYWG